MLMRNNVVIIANTEYSNLGIGYISSSLNKAGFRTKIVDSRFPDTVIKKEVEKHKPVFIGFSVTNHFNTIDRFIDIAKLLRHQGISCHFTAGGHYASLNPEELFSLMPQLDSIVLFEGEYTIVELADCLVSGKEWKPVKGIAFRVNDRVTVNEYRSLERDLDRFPYPFRPDLRIFGLEVPSATLLAGRGCVNRCSFCNEGIFYSIPGGPLKRMRKPGNVVKEMRMLYSRRDCLIFIFVDDDFPASSKWSRDFCAELKRYKLEGIKWKIACRADEVEESKFKELKEHGLFLVFLGLEDGTDSGLIKLDKRISASVNLQSINTLKKLGIGIEIGFLLFQPDTTFDSLMENLGFLEKICGDGYFAFTWVKLMPFYGTRIGEVLIAEGRLIKERGTWDYNFKEKWLDDYYDFIERNLGKWLWGDDGFENVAMWINNSFMVYSGFYGNDKAGMKLLNRFRKCVAANNLFLIDTMKETAAFFRSGDYLRNGNAKLDLCSTNIALKHKHYLKLAARIKNELYIHAVNTACERLTRGQ